MNDATPRPWTLDDGLVRMSDQAEQLKLDEGTKREWRAIGIADEEGFAEVVALAHPSNAALIVHAVNAHDKLVDALGWVIAYNKKEGLKLPAFVTIAYEEAAP